MVVCRFLGAGLIGGVVTVALIVMMSGLISSPPVAAHVESHPVGINFGDRRVDETPERKERSEKPDEPEPQKLPKRPTNAPGSDDPIAAEARSPDFTRMDTDNLLPGIRGPAGPNVGDRGGYSGALPVSRFQPQYPRQAVLNRQEGYVVVAFTIAVDGSVIDASIVESSPPRVFDRAALNSIMRWKFKPKTVDGSPVRQEAVQRLDFKLPD